MKQLKVEQAIKLNESKFWSNWTSLQIVRFQIFQDTLCFDFEVLLKALCEVLNRDVSSSELSGRRTHLRSEYITKYGFHTYNDAILQLSASERGLIGLELLEE